MSNIDIHPNYFDEPYKPLLTSEERVQLIMGSAGSGKSWSLFNMSVLWALEGRNILVLRKVAATITTSIYAEIYAAISSMGLMKHFEIRKSDRTFICKFNGACIMLKGADDLEKIKSIRSPNQYPIDTIIMEEAPEFTKDDFTQLKIRQRGDNGHFKKRIFLLLNPVSKNNWIYKEFYEGEPTETSLRMLKTTYKDNSHLSKEDIETLENLKYSDERMYNVYALGNWGVMGKLVYETTYDIPSDFNPRGMQCRLGVDYGGVNDPNTFTISYYDKTKKQIFIIEGVEHIGLDFAPFAELIIDTMKKHGIKENHLILCDSSDTRADKILQQYGLNIQHTSKGPGSKMMHLKWMLSNKIHYDYMNKALAEAFSIYSWKKDRHGEYMNDTNHDGSDLLDGVRYSFTNDMKTNIITPTYSDSF